MRFPFQFGFLSYLELLVRVFGEKGTLLAAPILNVLLLVSGYAALLRTTQRLFSDSRVTLLTLFLLCIYVQPLLACTLIYGLIPALAGSLWAVLFAVRFVQTGKKRESPGPLAARSPRMKPNAWIVAAAVAVVFALRAHTRGWVPLVAASRRCCCLRAAAQNGTGGVQARIGVSWQGVPDGELDGHGHARTGWAAGTAAILQN